jgi:2-polyprenyl-6-methoxyphenol hydroxylase-like FAD-dependent oxidoreductase
MRMKTENGRVLVVGMGVSGIATASRLRAAGWTPVLIERAPERRSGGYMVALFGAGQVAARRLGVLGHLHDRSPTMPNLDIDRRGRRRPGFSFSDAPGTPWVMLRGDVERAAFATLPSDVEIRYATVPTAIEQDGDGVDVTLLDTATNASVSERFDLVVGTDGLRSTVRRLVFGPHEDHLRRLNYMIAAFEYPGTPSGLTPGQGATLLEPDRAMHVFSFADHDPTILLTYKTDDVDAEFTRPPADRIRAVFGPEPLGDTLGAVVDALETADAPLFDSVEQTHLDTWHRGRVVLVGDSAWCVSLYAGMGVSAGLAGADLLGTVLERYPVDVDAALGEWEQTMRPYIADYQRSAFTQRPIFVMDDRRQIGLRRLVTRLRTVPVVRSVLDKVIPMNLGGLKSADIVGTALTTLSLDPASRSLHNRTAVAPAAS